jgi:hypothetical protein
VLANGSLLLVSQIGETALVSPTCGEISPTVSLIGETVAILEKSVPQFLQIKTSH